MIVIQVISVIAISALLIYMLFKGWNPIIAPLLAACLVMLFNGSNIVTGLAETYIPGFNQMITMFFLFFVGASILGALYKVTGAAETIADCFFRWFVEKRQGRNRAIMGGVVCMVTCFVCCYGGLDAFCAIFMLLPIIMMLAERSDVPRRLVPALMFGGISSAQLGPGSPLTGNNFGSVFFQVGATAAPVLGLIGMLFVLAMIVLYTRSSVGKAYDKGEHYDAGSYKAPAMRAADERPPSFWQSCRWWQCFSATLFCRSPPASLLNYISVWQLALRWPSCVSSPIWSRALSARWKARTGCYPPAAH